MAENLTDAQISYKARENVRGQSEVDSVIQACGSIVELTEMTRALSENMTVSNKDLAAKLRQDYLRVMQLRLNIEEVFGHDFSRFDKQNTNHNKMLRQFLDEAHKEIQTVEIQRKAREIIEHVLA